MFQKLVGALYLKRRPFVFIVFRRLAVDRKTTFIL